MSGVSLTEAAKLLTLSRRTVYRWRKEPGFPAPATEEGARGQKVRVELNELIAWCERTGKSFTYPPGWERKQADAGEEEPAGKLISLPGGRGEDPVESASSQAFSLRRALKSSRKSLVHALAKTEGLLARGQLEPTAALLNALAAVHEYLDKKVGGVDEEDEDLKQLSLQELADLVHDRNQAQFG